MSAEYQEQIPPAGHPRGGDGKHIALVASWKAKTEIWARLAKPQRNGEPQKSSSWIFQVGRLAKRTPSSSLAPGPSPAPESAPLRGQYSCTSHPWKVTEVYVTTASPTKTGDLGSKSSFLDALKSLEPISEVFSRSVNHCLSHATQLSNNWGGLFLILLDDEAEMQILA